jgi:hypothetical protein
LERNFTEALEALPSCTYLYVLDAQEHQITANVSTQGLSPEHFGRDRNDRPYLADALGGEPFSLSDAYISVAIPGARRSLRYGISRETKGFN